MGVRGLNSFVVRNNYGLCQNIKIIDEIQQFRRKNGDAIIIFDFMGFIYTFGKDAIELYLGGRFYKYLQELEQFLDKLIAAGATLVFFCDGQLQPEKLMEWCDRRNADFQQSINIMNNIYLGDARGKSPGGCKAIVKSFLKLIEMKKYGEIIISTDVECDSAVAQYAERNNAMAIIASDTDYLIYKGSFQFWYSDSLDRTRMCINRFDRDKLRALLSLDVDQMKMFAAIAGNDHTKQLVQERRCNFYVDANFCRQLELDDECYQKIADYIKSPEYAVTNDDLNTIEKAIKAYNIDFDLTIPTDPLKKFYQSNVLAYAFRELKIFQYDVNFMDFERRNNNQSFIDVLLIVFRKLGGILLKDRCNNNLKLKIVTKYDFNEEYKLKEHKLIYPTEINFDWMDIGLDSDSKYDDIRWNLLLWTIDLNAQLREELEQIPETHLVTVLALMFLHKAHEINTVQADALLALHHNIIKKELNWETISVPNPNSIDTETIRTAQLFNRTVLLIWDCLTVCGLQKFCHLDTFDGFYYYSMLKKYEKKGIMYKADITKIKPYRLYATED